MKRRKVEGQNRLEENVKRKIWTMNKELKQRKLAIKVLELGCKPIRDFFLTFGMLASTPVFIIIPQFNF